MNIKDILEQKKVEPIKPRNFVAKNAMKTTSGAGAHRDKKKEQKQGYEKHKGKRLAEGLFGIDSRTKGAIQNIVSQLSDIPGLWDHKAQTFTSQGLKELQSLLKNNEQHIEYAVNLTADDFDEGIDETSDFGEPREILEDVLRTLEREVEWPLTEIMDPREVKQLLAPIVKAINNKMMSIKEGRRDYGYDSFGNSLRPGDDEGNTEPPNNFAIYINGKKWKVFQGRGQYADDQYEMQQFRQLQAMAARKSQETGKKWEVVITGEAPTA